MRLGGQGPGGLFPSWPPRWGQLAAMIGACLVLADWARLHGGGVWWAPLVVGFGWEFVRPVWPRRGNK